MGVRTRCNTELNQFIAQNIKKKKTNYKAITAVQGGHFFDIKNSNKNHEE